MRSVLGRDVTGCDVMCDGMSLPGSTASSGRSNAYETSNLMRGTLGRKTQEDHEGSLSQNNDPSPTSVLPPPSPSTTTSY